MVANLAKPVVPFPSPERDISALRLVFESTHLESCPTSFNFHMHTVCSDGRLQPEELMEQAIAIGLQGMAITDHHTTDGYQRAQEWLIGYRENAAWHGKPVPSLHLWTGIEVTSQLLDTEVHILGYGFDVSDSVMQPYLQRHSPPADHAAAHRVVACIQAAGGLAVLAHPVRYRRSPEELITAAAHIGINGVETYYAYDNPTPWRSSPKQTEQVQRLSSSYGLLNTCGTDTHGRSLLQRL